MPRFYCPELTRDALKNKNLSDVAVPLSVEQVHYARRVLRLEPGDMVEIFDGRGYVCCGAMQWRAGAGAIRIASGRHVPPTTPVIDVAVATPKGPRAGDMVNQLSQLGADRLIPLKTQRGVVQPRAAKLAHLDRVAIESAKQSKRAYLLHIDQPDHLGGVVGRSYDVRLLADPLADAPSWLDRAEDRSSDQVENHLQGGRAYPPDTDLTKSWHDQLRQAGHILVLIGPEGGWTDQERATAIDAGALMWRLGPNVLRVETAAAAAVAILRYVTRH